MIYAFENCLLDMKRRELRRDGDLVPIEPGVFDLLQYLICNRERVVSKDDLIAAVWKGRIVSEATLSGRINAARCVLGDTGEQQRLLRTLPRKGFRFVGEVREVHRSESATSLAAEHDDLTARAAAPSSAPPLPDRPSIAVLAFTNLSGDPEQEYFADGMVEDIITELSRFSELFVIARNSSFQYKGKSVDVRQVGHQLGVRYVLEGSIRRDCRRVRVNVQLIDVQTGGHRWAEHYDRQIENVFEVQDEIARTVAAILAAHVTKAEAERMVLKSPASWQAYDYYMRAADANAAFLRHMQVAAIYKARRLLEQCLGIDPDFARAHVLQSRTQVSTWALPLDGDYMNAAVLEAAHRAAETAVQLDSNLRQAHYQLGMVLSYRGQSEAAVAECERAVALNPNYTDYRFASVLVHAGQSERAIDVAKAHLRLDPFTPPIARGWLGLAYYMRRRYPEAVAALREFVSQTPNFRPGRAWLTAAYAQLGRLEEARAEAAEVLRLDPGWTSSGIFRRGGYLRDEDVDHLVDGLHKAGLPEQ